MQCQTACLQIIHQQQVQGDRLCQLVKCQVIIQSEDLLFAFLQKCIMSYIHEFKVHIPVDI